ncbi:netrin receptor UNC5A-like [Gigantopelta aegis]|uniref:netrin receptor UNC5A-like n=1 Tax=Gigantopelta aegis TaxID=1735272 RepID=UPI001B8889BB|nr:netrin receptor UNC5A-like [Gigantopelta aegis]
MTLCVLKYYVYFTVHGGWGNWTDWDQCSLTCGGGTQTRRRRCNNPAPTQPEGKTCSGSDSQTRDCNTEECSVCRSTAVRNGLRSRAQCNGTESSLDCVSVCRHPDHVVDPSNKQLVCCRDGFWDAERPKVASCIKIEAPSVATVTTTATYQTDSCLSQTSLSGIESSVHQNTATLACSSHSSCQTNVQAVGCGDSYRGRRSILTTVVIQMTENILGGDLQLGDFLATQTKRTWKRDQTAQDIVIIAKFILRLPMDTTVVLLSNIT